MATMKTAAAAAVLAAAATAARAEQGLPPEAQTDPEPIVADPLTNPHGFSGRKARVTILSRGEEESWDVFVGLNDYQASIKRDKEVVIPEEVFRACIEGAVGIRRERPDPENAPDKFIEVPAPRFAYQLHGFVEPERTAA